MHKIAAQFEMIIVHDVNSRFKEAQYIIWCVCNLTNVFNVVNNICARGLNIIYEIY